MDSSSSAASATTKTEAEDAVGVTNDCCAASVTMSATDSDGETALLGTDRGDNGDDSEFLQGSLLAAEPVVFRRPRDGKRCALSPLLVDFRRLMRGGTAAKHSATTKSLTLVRGVPNADLLHATVGLYDVSLDEMTPDVLYETVCEKWARTIVLLRSTQDVLEEFERSRCSSSAVTDGKRKPDAGDCDARLRQGVVTDSDRYEPGDGLQATFAAAYSDTDSDDEEGEESEDQENCRRSELSCRNENATCERATEDDDFSQGIGTFLKAVVDRRQQRTSDPGDRPLCRSAVGAESRLGAALTYEKKYTKSGEKVIHVTLLSVRRRYRGMGIGKYLLQLVKDPAVVGAYDAVVAHVDNSAVEFFSRYGFSDDVVLNSRWRELADQFTNCTLMSYVPPYAGQTFPDKVLDLDLFSMEQDMKKWKEKHLESYQAQVTCVGRMKAEIIRLRAIVSTQQHLIDDLQHRVDSLQQQHQRLLLLLRPEMDGSRKGVRYDLSVNASGGSGGDDECADASDEEEGDSGGDAGSSAKHLIEGLEQELKRYRLCGAPLPPDDSYGYSGDNSCGGSQQHDSPAPHCPSAADYDDELRRYVVARRHDEVYDHGKDIALFHQICEDFMTSMRKDPKIQRSYSITSISKALLQSSATDRYAAKRRNYGDSALTMRAYFCGTQEQPDRLHEIMKGGFSDSDFVNGDYGRGLYFARYASTAANFSTTGKLIIAEILLGKCETVLKKDRKRSHPANGYDSLLTPGRLLPTKDDGTVIQEYVLFDAAQALPLFQIDYRPADADG